ncbi:MAG TPA: class I SAM-dependent methyltransferase [Terriglobales bacterium]|nr:class I SAM-dependent methyltransferase [Terriglobales bacterium]HXY48994.1 class I SAM-dependent methyltransferase [Terriglobales bacterium]
MKPLQISISNSGPVPPEHNSNRNVPFLLNGAEVKSNSTTDRILWAVAAYFRRKRFKEFEKFLAGIETIIDFGGTPSIWTSIGRRGVVLLNLDEQPAPADFLVVKGDARNTSFPDLSFDLAFSNSTLEHVGTWEDQRAFASELCRVGKRIYCQTPACRFFFEPHYFTPFVDWCQFLLKHYWFVRYCTYYGLKWKPSRGQVKDFQSHLRLLTFSEMQRLFPNCEIRKERFLGMTKAYIAIR